MGSPTDTALGTSVLRFRQVEDFLLEGIAAGRFPVGQRLPSIAWTAAHLGFAPKTVHKAYCLLLERGVIESVPRKGYYVRSAAPVLPLNIFLMLDNYSPYKQSLFQTIKQDFGTEAELSVHFHFYDPALFRRYIREHARRYTTYIISPFYMADLEEVLSCLPPERLYLLGRHPRSLRQEYHGVFQDFRQDMVRGLTATGDRMWKYDRLVLYFRDSVTKPPVELMNGFVEFCRDMRMDHRIVRANETPRIHQGEAYVVIDDEDLIALVQMAHEKHYTLGQDLGLISYNDTPIKSVISTSGVSVISTDFEQMGHSIVSMVQQGCFDHLINPSCFIDRGSF